MYTYLHKKDMKIGPILVHPSRIQLDFNGPIRPVVDVETNHQLKWLICCRRWFWLYYIDEENSYNDRFIVNICLDDNTHHKWLNGGTCVCVFVFAIVFLYVPACLMIMII